MNQIPSPVAVRALVTDIVGIDSVKFDTMPMVYARDTALFVFSPADSGEHVDRSSRLTMRATEPGFCSLPSSRRKRCCRRSCATCPGNPQGVAFAPVWLDTCVVLPDTTLRTRSPTKRIRSPGSLPTAPEDRLPFPATTCSPYPFLPTPCGRDIPADFQGVRHQFTVAVRHETAVVLRDALQLSARDNARPGPMLQDISDRHHIPGRRHYRTRSNDALSSLNWSFSKGSHFKVDSLYSSRLLGKVSGSSGLPIVNPILLSSFYAPCRDRYHFRRRPVVLRYRHAYVYRNRSGRACASKKIYFTRPTGFCLFHCSGEQKRKKKRPASPRQGRDAGLFLRCFAGYCGVCGADLGCNASEIDPLNSLEYLNSGTTRL